MPNNPIHIQGKISLSIVTAEERIVFNAYRLIVAVDFEKGIVWIKWIGTREDYDEIDVTEADYGQ